MSEVQVVNRLDTRLAANAALNQFDVELSRNEHLFALPHGVSQWLINHTLRGQAESNITMLYVTANVLLTTIPMAIGLYLLEGMVPNWVVSLLGIGYVIFNLLVHARSFILALHYSTHSPVFNRQWKWLKHINQTVLCNFFGMPTWSYYAHHIAMHHCEDNTDPYDLSSTMPYQRDSKLDHLKYMLRHTFLIWFELPYILIKRKRYQVATRTLLGSLIFFGGITALYQVRPIATLFTFILPTIILSVAFMEGNWKQHIFVDPEAPDNNYRSTFACINTPTNALNFNDGYHIEHHENPAMPWYRLPRYFQTKLDKYAEQDGFIFSGLGSGQVGTMVLNGQLEDLADHYVNVGQPQRSKVELVAEFKRRLQPIRG